MAPRRSHVKSRRGCQTCKRRHVKCDEGGPPCMNCATRGTSCNYDSEGGRAGALAPSNKSAELTPSPSQQSDTSTSTSPINRLLELELFHRWSTETFKSVCCTQSAEEQQVLQVLVPRDALKPGHGFLLDTILAFSALEIAAEAVDGTESPKYATIGLEYYDRAMPALRKELSNIGLENHLAIYLCSSFIAGINLALPQLITENDSPRNMLDSAVTVFELMNGTLSVTLKSFEDPEWLRATPKEWRETISQAINVALNPSPHDILDTGTREAIARLHAFNNDMADDTRSYMTLSHSEYQTAIWSLEQQFAIEIDKPFITGYCASYPGFVGRDFAKALAKREWLALLILMHYAVLVERLGEKVWWARRAGRNLIEEASQQSFPGALRQDWLDSINWTRKQVGLLPLGS